MEKRCSRLERLSRFLQALCWLSTCLLALTLAPYRSQVRELVSFYFGFYFLILAVSFALLVYSRKVNLKVALLFLIGTFIWIMPIARIVTGISGASIKLNFSQVKNWNENNCLDIETVCFSSEDLNAPPKGYKIFSSGKYNFLLPDTVKVVADEFGIEGEPGFLVQMNVGEKPILFGAVGDSVTNPWVKRRNTARRIVALLRKQNAPLPTIIHYNARGTIVSFGASMLTVYASLIPNINGITDGCVLGPWCNKFFSRGIFVTEKTFFQSQSLSQP